MGSLTSTPKVAQSAAASTTTTSISTDIEDSSEEEASSVENASEERKKSLLARDRSRYGTIATSLQGVLGSVAGDGARKTLLGQ